MQEFHVKLLEPGDILGRAVLGRTGLTILEEGTVLTEQYIKRIRQLGVVSVVVKNRKLPMPESSLAEQKEPDLNHTHFSASTEVPVSDFRARKQTLAELMQLAESEKVHGRIAIPFVEQRFKRLFRGLVCDISSHQKIMDLLTMLRTYDQGLFKHTLSVTALSVMLGISLQYDNAKLLDLTVGSLLFDVGMTRVPQSILQCVRELTLEERVILQNHTIEGYRLTEGLEGVSAVSAKCSLLHHERFDGSGYPFHMKGEDIPEIVQIVAISDVYDALISPRPYRQAYRESEAIEFLFGAGDRFFDAELVKAFLKNISVFPISTTLKLSSGQVGVVAAHASGLSHRPLLRIIREADGTRVSHPYELDLTKKRDVVVLHSCVE